jgi:hypothetical protein
MMTFNEEVGIEPTPAEHVGWFVSRVMGMR